MENPHRVRLVLCRHTQTDYNAQKRLCGARDDIVLNATGEQQAKELAVKLTDFRIRGIYSSDLKRTRQAAEIIRSQFPHLHVQYDARLREVDIGEIGTMLKEEAKIRFPSPHHQLEHPAYDFRDIGGEYRMDVMSRMIECFQEIALRYGTNRPDEETPTVVVVSHGTALRDVREKLGDTSKLHEQGDYQFLDFTTP